MHPPAHPFAQDVAHCSDHCGEQPTVWDLPNVPPALKREWLSLETRRHFLARGANALSWAGLASLLGGGASRALASTPAPGALRLPHQAPKAKRAIYLFQAGSPSQFETWDYKPALQDMFDKDLPESVRGGQVLTGMTASQAPTSAWPTTASSWRARASSLSLLRGSAYICTFSGRLSCQLKAPSQLQVVNNKVLGARDLARYYRQKHRPESSSRAVVCARAEAGGR